MQRELLCTCPAYKGQLEDRAVEDQLLGETNRCLSARTLLGTLSETTKWWDGFCMSKICLLRSYSPVGDLEDDTTHVLNPKETWKRDRLGVQKTNERGNNLHPQKRKGTLLRVYLCWKTHSQRRRSPLWMPHAWGVPCLTVDTSHL